MTFGFVPPPYAPRLWAKVRDLLDASVKRGGNDWQEVQDSLADHRSQLWVEEREGGPVAAMVTRLDGDTLEVWLAGGTVIRAVPHLETALQASREAGATNSRIIGRKGWSRVLRSYGWNAEGDDLVKRWA